MDTRWFKEDRTKYSGAEYTKQKAASEKAIRNSTLMSRRLKDICEEEVRATYHVETDFENPAYERLIIAAAATRKAYLTIIKLLP
jgi:hypothetical protein